MTDLLTSITRTIIPTIIGWIVGGLALVGVTIPESVQGWISGLLVFLVALIWYVVVRALEHKWPKLGWLLGVPKKPVYSSDAPDGDLAAAEQIADADAAAARAADPTIPDPR